MRKTLLTSLISFSLLIGLYAQSGKMAPVDKETIQNYLNTFSEKSPVKSEDILDWEITDSHIDKRNGIQFVYIRQIVNGIPVQNGLANFTLKDGKIAYMGDRLIHDLKKDLPSSNPGINAATAITVAAEKLGLPAPTSLNLINQESERNYLFSNGDISLENIPVELMYIKAKDEKMHLAWNLSIYELSAQNWWSVSIDANNGELLDKVNWVTHCEFGHAHINNDNIADQHKLNNTSKSQSQIDSSEYRVFALPAESPNHGPYVLVSDPADSLASPFGWHDTDAIPGPEFTITRGNNVHAYEDIDGSNSNNPGTSPDGGSSLQFDFPFTPGTAPSSYTDAATTNLFYMNNVIHDVWYYYGFDEASGNFQENNYGRGGLDGDYVRAEAQDGGGNSNANFATPSDGNRPRMQMYLWGTGNSARDGDFDNGIIIHEYGHGISNRLTGGASQTGCLSSSNFPEQMGEGWSDWFGIMMTIDSGDTGSDRRGIGTFAQGASTNGTGIRPAPYSTDFAQNDYTYGNTNGGLSVPHGVGFVFATALWDLNWALINQYGGVPDPDLYTGTGGNNIAMNLVIAGLKIQPCGPGMLDGRDAILAADQLLYNGAHQCLIWDVFANRGFGYFASQGSNNDRTDQIEDFTPSPFCQTITAAPIANFNYNPQTPFCEGEIRFVDSSLNIAQHWFWDFGDGTTDTIPNPRHVYSQTGTYNVQMIISNTLGSDTITKTVTVGQPNAPVVTDKSLCSSIPFVNLIASNPGSGNIEWYDSALNLLSTSVIYNHAISSDETLLVRYNLTGTGAGSTCVSFFDTVKITVFESDFTYNQNGLTYNFTDASSNATSWSWNFGDGATSTQQNPSHTYANAGNYNVSLAINGIPCSKQETVNVISSLSELNGNSRFNLFPNPTKGLLSLELKEIAKADMHYSIQDLSGKTLVRNKIEEGQKSISIDLKNLETAMYLIQIEGEDFTEVRKLLLEK